MRHDQAERELCLPGEDSIFGVDPRVFGWDDV